MTDRSHPANITVVPQLADRDRLTTAFRFFLGIPHILLVGGPAIAGAWIGWQSHENLSLGSSAGIFGTVAMVVTVVAWFAILFTGSHPDGLWRLAAYYLRWRVRAIAYLALLRDEYPPFGDGAYPAELVLAEPPASRDRLTVFFRVVVAIPHLICLGLLSVAWAFTTTVAWLSILFTGRYPEMLYGFALGVFAWTTRVEAYLLLLNDEYPPFSLRV
jgi:hypothetical protein